MHIIISNRFIFCCAFFVTSTLFFAQTKSSVVQTIAGSKVYIHKVEKSQSLYAISKLYQVNLEDIYRLNPEVKAGVKAGQEIKIPVAFSSPSLTPSPAAANTNSIVIDTLKFLTHKVTKGETVYSIIKKHNLTEKQLNTYNTSLSQGLKEGQLIIVGEKTKRKTPSKEPIVAKENKQQIYTKEKTHTPIVDSNSFKPFLKEKKLSYQIALILPFRLETIINMDANELIKNNVSFPNISALSLDFYLGFKRAVDSLTDKGFEVNIDSYDIDDKDSTKIIQLVADTKFKEFDMIFGPLYANGFKIISKKAKEFHIPIISPITQQNKILFNNFYTSKTNPSQFTLLESLADYCIDSLKKENANIVLMLPFEKDKRETQFVVAFRKYYNQKMKDAGRIKDTIITTKDLSTLKNNFVAGIKNVVITLSDNEVFIADFSTQLAIFADKKDIVLAGWQGISEMDNIDQEYLNQLHFTFPHQFNITNTANYAPILDYYKTQQESYPSEHYFMGFDIAFYYLKNLKEQGPNFVYRLNAFPMETNYMRFNYNRPDNSTGFDNRGVYIFKYNDYQLQKTGWK